MTEWTSFFDSCEVPAAVFGPVSTRLQSPCKPANLKGIRFLNASLVQPHAFDNCQKLICCHKITGVIHRNPAQHRSKLPLLSGCANHQHVLGLGGLCSTLCSTKKIIFVLKFEWLQFKNFAKSSIYYNLVALTDQ